MEQQHRNVVGGKIRQLRNACGLSQEQLAIQCSRLGFEIARGTLAKIESQIRGISDVELFVIAHVLKTPIADFFPRTILNDLRNDRITAFHKRKNGTD